MAIRGKKTFEALTIEEVNYIAGFFDGEGNINIYKIDTENNRKVHQLRNPKYELSVAFYNTDKEIMEWLHSVFGGYLQTRNRDNSPKRDKEWKENYCVRMTSNQALEFIRLVYPYLRIKKKQADVAIAFQEVKLKKISRFAKVTSEQLAFFESSYLQLRKLIDCCRWRKNGSTAAKRLHPQRLNETTS